MKKSIALFLFFTLICHLSSCVFGQDPVLRSLGAYDSKQCYEEGWRDYTDYHKYYYTNAQISDNSYLQQISEKDLSELNELLDNFESMIELHREFDPTIEIVVHYDFNREIIDSEDYLYTEVEQHSFEGHTIFDSYDVYFFDTQSNVLYYFHNNN